VVAAHREVSQVPRLPWNLRPNKFHGCRGTYGPQVPRLGVELNPRRSPTVTVGLKFHGCRETTNTHVLNVRSGRSNPASTVVDAGPNTLPQPDYGVTQIGDCVVTQRPRDRQNAGLTESGAFTESGKLP